MGSSSKVVKVTSRMILAVIGGNYRKKDLSLFQFFRKYSQRSRPKTKLQGIHKSRCFQKHVSKKTNTEPKRILNSDSRNPCLISRIINGTGAMSIRKGDARAMYIPPENITMLKSIHDNHSKIIFDFTFRPPQRQ